MKNRILVTLMFLLSFACVVFIGCTSIPTTTQKVAATCASASAALKAATAAEKAGKLNRAQALKVSEAGHKIALVCSADNPPTLDSVKQAALDAAVAELARHIGSTP